MQTDLEARIRLQAAHAAAAVAESLGAPVGADQLNERIRRILTGVTAESEFTYVLNWLGRVKLVHALDQNQTPASSKSELRVPDLLVVFENGAIQTPVLIEVKSTLNSVLNWRPDYYESLQRYAETLGLPLLVAWQQRKWGGLWTLFDAGHFKRPNKNYVMRFDDALRQTLMSELAGDVAIGFKPGAGLVLHMAKEELVASEDVDGVRTDNWRLRIERAYPVDGDSQEIDSFPGLMALLFMAPLQDSLESSDTHFVQKFSVPDEGAMVWAHRSLIELVHPGSTAPIPWKRMLLRNQRPVAFSVIKEALGTAMERKVVHMVMHIVPQDRPAFLGAAT